MELIILQIILNCICPHEQTIVWSSAVCESQSHKFSIYTDDPVCEYNTVFDFSRCHMINGSHMINSVCHDQRT